MIRNIFYKNNFYFCCFIIFLNSCSNAISTLEGITMSATESLKNIEKLRKQRKRNEMCFDEFENGSSIFINFSDYKPSKKYLFVSVGSEYKRKLTLTKVSNRQSR